MIHAKLTNACMSQFMDGYYVFMKQIIYMLP